MMITNTYPLSLPEVASRLGVSRQRVWTWVRADRIRASMICGRWAVRVEDCLYPADLRRKDGSPETISSV